MDDWWEGGNNDMEDPSSWGVDNTDYSADAGIQSLMDQWTNAPNPTDQRLADGTQTTPQSAEPGFLQQVLSSLTGSTANDIMKLLLAGGTALGGLTSKGTPTKSIADLKTAVGAGPNNFSAPQQAKVDSYFGSTPRVGSDMPRVYAADMQSPITQGYNAYSDAEVGKHLGIAQGQAPGADLSVLRDKARSLYGITPTQFNRVANVPDTSTTPPGGYTDERIRQTVTEARAATPGVTLEQLRQRAGTLGIPAEQFNRAMLGVQGFAHGGALSQVFASGGPSQFVTDGGGGGGQDDVVEARLAPGEYVFDADVVSALGDGNNAEGARRLDELRRRVREHKRAAPVDDIPPRAMSPLEYMTGGGTSNGNR